MRLLFDSTTPAHSIPSGAQMILAYTDGRITSGNYAAAKASHPNALLVSCTVVGTPGAKVGDCESGDMDVPSLVHWMADEVHAGRHPTGYCNSSTWPQVEAAVALVGLKPIRDLSYMIAQYDGVPAIPTGWQARGCVAKQYRSDTAQNLDYSVVADHWPGVDAPQAQPTKEDLVNLVVAPDGTLHTIGVSATGHPLHFFKAPNTAANQGWSVIDITDVIAAANPGVPLYTVQP